MISKIKAFLTKYPTIAEIIRFCIVGGIATVVDFLVMGVVLYIFDPSLYPNFFNVFIGGKGDPSLTANMVGTGCGFIVGLIFNYILSVVFVFISKGNSKSTTGFLLFTLLSAVGLGIHEVGMFLLNDLLGINEWIVKIILTVVVLVYNYVSRKLFIFKDKKTNPDKIEEQK